MITNKCSDCGKPLQYCKCKMIITNLVNGLVVRNGETLNLKTTLTMNPDGTTESLVTESNVVPQTEYEYFQQIGDE